MYSFIRIYSFICIVFAGRVKPVRNRTFSVSKPDNLDGVAIDSLLIYKGITIWHFLGAIF
jgi:hypothetical protein